MGERPLYVNPVNVEHIDISSVQRQGWNRMLGGVDAGGEKARIQGHFRGGISNSFQTPGKLHSDHRRQFYIAI